MAGYTRQSSFADGDIIQAADFNDEYNQLLNAFSNTTGHAHDGTAAEGPVIGLIGDPGVAAPINKVVVDNTNNRVGLFIDAGGLGSSVEQLRFQDGVIVPVTNNDIDLGTSGAKFKDLYLAGDANIAGTMTLSGNVIVSGTLGADLIPDADDTRDIGSSGAEWKDLYIDGVAYIDSIAMPTTTVTDILDEDTMTSDSATALATQQSIKAYVDAQVTAQDLDFQADTGGALNIDLDSETLTFTGGTGIDTSGLGNAVTFAIDSTVATLTGTQTLTNKTLTTPIISTISNTGTLTLPTSTDTLVGRATTDTLTNKTLTSPTITTATLNGAVSGTSIKDEDDMLSDSASHLATQQSIKAYVDAQVTAQDLDFQGDSGGALSIDLDSETLTIAGGTGIDTSGSGNTLTVAIDSTVATKAYVSSQVDLVNDTTPQLGGDLSTNSNDILFADNDVASFGAGGDLQIYHDTLNSYISERGTGNLYLGANGNIELFKHLSTDRMAKFITDGAVELYHANSKKIETTASGVTVTGTTTATTFSGDLNGTINTATTATTQTAGTNNTTVATTAYSETAANNAAVALAIALG